MARHFVEHQCPAGLAMLVSCEHLGQTFYNTTFVPNVTGWQTSLAYLNPRVMRLNAEFAW